MRIIFLEAVQNLGGARKSTIELAKRLQNIGHEVLIVDFWGSCKPFVEMACNANIDLLILDPKEKPIILASSSKIKSLVNKVSYLFYEQQLKKKFQKIIDDFSPDVISLNNCKSLSIVPKSTSFEIHYIARGWFNYNSVPFKDKYILRKYRENIKFFTVSQSTRQAIYSGGLAPLENIYVMTDVIKASIINEKKELNSFTSWDKSNNRPFIIHHCGGFLETKGQLVTFEVAKLLVEKNIDFRLIYTGIIYEGDMSKRYYQKLINDIKISNLEDVVKIVLDPPDIMDYFYKSDVLLLPSYTEGLPRVTLEAMAFGKPVIANPVGGIIDVVINNHTGYVTDFNAVDDYYKSILELLNDKQKYEEISKNCINLIKDNYSEKNQEIAISKYYG